MIHFDLVVIGGGPAGMAAALRAKELGVERVVIVERDDHLGGILTQCIHTGFGLHYFGEELSGPEYAHRFSEQLKSTDIAVMTGTMALSIEKDLTVTTLSPSCGLVKLGAKAIILAMGCRERPRGALTISGSRPAGIMTAGAAQKFVNLDGYLPGKQVVILGSGDIGLIMARRMTLEGAEVKMVCELLPFSGGLTRNIVQCLDDFGIPLRLSCTVIETHGKERLEGVTVANVDERLNPIPGTEEYVPCDTLLLSVGLIPENELTKDLGLPLDPVTGGPVVDEMRGTAHPGIFACGNVLQVHDLVDYVTLEAQLAGEGAANHILNNTAAEKQYITPACGSGVRYIVPQRLNLKNNRDTKLYFRVGAVHKNARVILEADGRVLSNKKKVKLAPGEMEDVLLKSADLTTLTPQSTLTIRIED